MIQFLLLVIIAGIACLVGWYAAKKDGNEKQQYTKEEICDIAEETENVAENIDTKQAEKQRLYKELKQTTVHKHKQIVEKAYQHACVVHEYRMKYIQQIHNIIKQYMQVLVNKYNQLTYTDDYGLVVENAFLKEFNNNFVKRVLLPKLSDPLSDKILKESFHKINDILNRFKEEYYNPLLNMAREDADTYKDYLVAKNDIESSLDIDRDVYCLYKHSFFQFTIEIGNNTKSSNVMSAITIFVTEYDYDYDDEYDDKEEVSKHIALQLFLYEKQFVKNTSDTTTNNTIAPLEYEKYIAAQLKEIGFNARVTKGSGDQGADVIAKKDGKSFAIQCKMYSSPVGNKAVQEANAGRDFYKCDYGVVVSNASFTKSARQAANACNIILLNDTQLDKLLKYTE